MTYPKCATGGSLLSFKQGQHGGREAVSCSFLIFFFFLVLVFVLSPRVVGGRCWWVFLLSAPWPPAPLSVCYLSVVKVCVGCQFVKVTISTTVHKVKCVINGRERRKVEGAAPPADDDESMRALEDAIWRGTCDLLTEFLSACPLSSSFFVSRQLTLMHTIPTPHLGTGSSDSSRGGKRTKTTTPPPPPPRTRKACG